MLWEKKRGDEFFLGVTRCVTGKDLAEDLMKRLGGECGVVRLAEEAKGKLRQ